MSGLLAAVHLDPRITVPILVIAIVGLGMYWRRLGRGSVPRSRRRLRRAGLIVGGVAGVAGVAALSFMDPTIRPGWYLVAWATVAASIVPAVAVAAADAMVTVRFHQRSLNRRAERDARRIRQAMLQAETRED